MRNKEVTHTAISKNYSNLILQKIIKGFDYICFTDKPHLKVKPWKTIIVEALIKDDFIRSNRYYKIYPDKSLGNYDLSIYLDANYLIIGNLNELDDRFFAKILWPFFLMNLLVLIVVHAFMKNMKQF